MADLLRDKIAIVTGAAHPKGIGRAIVDAFRRQGAQVIISDIAGAAGLEESGGLACDVTSREQVKQLINKVTEQYGAIDILVNNAGIGIGSSDFLELTERDWELSLNVNLRGVANMCQAAIPGMRGKGGAIVNIASLAGLGAMDSIPACYTASKFATVGLTKQLAMQFAADGIRCNAVCPGSVVTQMHAQSMALLAEKHQVTPEEAQAMEEANIPLGRSAQPGEVADAAVYLASDLARYITGVAMPVAGGMSPGL
jgi:NAD(P)-dependent dehydrogenase (short-subunit alcohol dehydrogenase family)